MGHPPVMIREWAGKYTVVSEKKDSAGHHKKLGTYPSKKAAKERLRQVEATKAAKG